MSEIVPRDNLREFFKKWPRFYVFAVHAFGPAYLGGFGPRKFLLDYFPVINKHIIFNIGSGPVRLRSDVKNIDIEQYGEVDIVADITNLPVTSSSVDSFICDNVLEHVMDPYTAVSELHRILTPGGVGYISTPFIYPFHASPYDYQRWTAEGLKELLKEFSSVEVGVRSGLFSSLTVLFCYMIPSFLSFGSDRLYWLLVNLSLVLFWPLKFLDIFTNKLPFSKHTASVFYCVVKK